MKNRPFFSIVIPTYNRCNFLAANLDILLKQTFNDFEIIVSDNLSTDKTEKVVRPFKDKRIKYFRNKTNLGFIGNSQKAISRAKGKYIFTLGDDDLVLFPDTLAYLKKLLNKEKYGFIRLNFLERKLSGKGLQKVYRDINQDLIIKKNSENIKILEFFEEVHVGHIAGLVFKNEGVNSKNFLDSEIAPWIKIVFENTRRYGGCFLSNYYVVISLPKAEQIVEMCAAYNAIDNKRLMYEYYTNYAYSLLPERQRKEYRRNYYGKFIQLLPSVKFYSNNQNLWKFIKRLIKIEKSLKFDFRLWFYFVVSFIIPRIVLEMIRQIQHRLSNKIINIKNYKKVITRFEYLDEKFYGFLQNNC